MLRWCVGCPTASETHNFPFHSQKVSGWSLRIFYSIHIFRDEPNCAPRGCLDNKISLPRLAETTRIRARQSVKLHWGPRKHRARAWQWEGFGLNRGQLYRKSWWHTGRLTWNIIIELGKIMFLSKLVIWMIHVNLPGCTHWRDLESEMFCRRCFVSFFGGGFEKKQVLYIAANWW